MKRANDALPPVLRISNRDWQRMTRNGYGVVRVQNDIVAIVRPVERPVPFERGATEPQIIEAWEQQQESEK